MRGKAFFRETSPKHRVHVWKAIFQSDSLKIAAARLAGICDAVAVDVIYSDSSAGHLKWQKYLLATFVFTCEDVCKYMYSQKEKDTAFQRWKAFPISNACMSLDLGDVDKVPVKKGGPFDQNRRQIPNVEDYEYAAEIDIDVRPWFCLSDDES